MYAPRGNRGGDDEPGKSHRKRSGGICEPYVMIYDDMIIIIIIRPFSPRLLFRNQETTPLGHPRFPPTLVRRSRPGEDGLHATTTMTTTMDIIGASRPRGPSPSPPLCPVCSAHSFY